MHPLTYRVSKEIPKLEFEQFRHLEDRDRIMAVRELAIDQVKDDNSTTRGETYWSSKVGKPQAHRTISSGEMWDDESHSLWPDRTERQRALEAGLTPLLDAALTAEQRALVRLYYDVGESQADIAGRLGITKQAVGQRFKTIHKNIREALEKTFEEVKKDATKE